jgi:hypothetical protein
LEDLIAKSRNGEEDWKAIEAIRIEYERELRECQFNHEPIDDRRFMVEHRTGKEFATETGKPRISRFEAFKIFARYLLSPAWIYLVTWFLVIAMLVAAASHSLLGPRSVEGSDTSTPVANEAAAPAQ